MCLCYYYYNVLSFLADIDILRDQLLPVADDFSGQLTLAISDEEEFADELTSLGLDDWGEDVAMAIWGSPKEKYPMVEEYDTETLQEFIQVRGHRV